MNGFMDRSLSYLELVNQGYEWGELDMADVSVNLGSSIPSRSYRAQVCKDL